MKIALKKQKALIKMISSQTVDDWLANIKVCEKSLGKLFPDWWEEKIVRPNVLRETRTKFNW